MNTYKGHHLTVFMITLGNHDFYLENISRLRKSLPQHELVIWNNGSSTEFESKLKSLADVYISSSHNMWTSKCFGFAILYLEYDWLIILAPDIKVKDAWWDQIHPLMDNNVGIIGDSMKHPLSTSEVNQCNENNLPDGFHVINRRMVNDIGSLSPSFGIWGHDLTEFKLRALKNGWKILSVDSGLEHYGDGHTGVDYAKSFMGDEEFNKMHSRSCMALNQARNTWWELKV